MRKMKEILMMVIWFLILIYPFPVFAQAKSGCPNESESWKDGLWCKVCDKILEDKSKEGRCKKCKQELMKVKLCIRKGYICEVCEIASLKKGWCKRCRKRRKEYIDRARVIYRCNICEEEYD